VCPPAIAQEGRPFLGDVRGLGLMLGVECISDAASKAPAPKFACWVRVRCSHHLNKSANPTSLLLLQSCKAELGCVPHPRLIGKIGDARQHIRASLHFSRKYHL